MSFDIAGGLRNLKGGALDALRGPYVSVSAANLAIPNVVVDSINFREGKQVDIIVSAGVYRTYWWQGGYADENLVEMLIKGDKGDPFTYDDFTPEEIEDLKQPAIDAAVVATEAANNAVIATENAVEATGDAITATNNAIGATQEAIDAANNTVQAIIDTVAATDAANEATSNANEATENTNEAIEAANTATANTIDAINDAVEATTNANTATENANNAADAANTAAISANDAAQTAIDAASTAENARGWSPEFVSEEDGEDREVWKLNAWINGTGDAPTTNVGLYLKSDGTYTSIKSEAANYKGEKGDTGEQGIPGISTTNMSEFSLLGRDIAGTGTPKSLAPVGLKLLSDSVINGEGDTASTGFANNRIISLNNPKGGFLKTSALTNGAIKIKLPSNATVFAVLNGTINLNGNQGLIRFSISCYTASMGINAYAVFSSRPFNSLTVRWFTDGTSPYVTIGETNGNLTSRMAITVDNVQLSHGGATTIYVKNFALELSIIETFTGTLEATVTDTRPSFNPSQIMDGYSVGANTDFTNTDTLSQILGKAQGQINAIKSGAIFNTGSALNLIKGDGTFQPLSTLPAFTATKLLTPRNINGVAFDGTGNITVADATKVAKSGDTMTGDLLLSSATPPNNLSATPKQYVDNSVSNAIAGLQFKADVLAASTANVSIASAPSTLDGVTLASTNRILLKDQTNATENGIYVFNGAGNALTRSLDADSGVELANKTIPVNQGTANADAWWKILNDTITLGTTNILFSKVGSEGNYTPGSQISIAGNTISVAQDSTHRFVTDAEKTSWDAKATRIKGTVSANTTEVNTTTYKDVTVTGAAVGDVVVVVDPILKSGSRTDIFYMISAKVTATDTVRVYYSNLMAGTDEPSGNPTFAFTSQAPSLTSYPLVVDFTVIK